MNFMHPTTALALAHSLEEARIAEAKRLALLRQLRRGRSRA